MLRNEVLIFIFIIWAICTTILFVNGLARIEKTLNKINFVIKHETIVAEEKIEVEPVVQPIPEPEPEIVAPVKMYYAVPLSEDLQDHIFTECAKYNIDPAIVIAMIGKESVYNEDAIGDGGNSHGLMQIQPRWHYDRIKRLGVTNLFNPYQNVTVGVDILAELFATGKSTEWVLMAYNGGRAYANEKIALGIVSDYANTVITNARTLDTYFIEEEV